ncbi:sugar-binding transcriptional regulator [Inquilinus sp. OTU3971]|uniref:sugar-binding transcriptional regulator n=1 Tax=Inquilinus sp. OTU3971 TaxID=3043855 RepID=UPI00313E6A08
MPGIDQAERKRDQAARAAWLSYVSGLTQDEIARRLNVSRMAAQRLLAFAAQEGMVKVRIDHPIAACMELGERIARRHGLRFCEVVPADPVAPAQPNLPALAIAGATWIERLVDTDAPLVIGVGNGRSVRAAVEEMASSPRPQHQVVSVTGNIARDSSYNPFDVVMRLGDRLGAQRFLMPAPLIAESAEDRRVLEEQKPFREIMALAARADAILIGIGQLDDSAPVLQDKVISRAEYQELRQAGAIGEVLGNFLDAEGQILPSPLRDRVIGLPLDAVARRPAIAIAGGAVKVPAIRAVLSRGLLQGLITDETAASALVSLG